MKKNKKYFPLFVDLSEKKAVVVGAGRIARRRVGVLLDFCPSVTVIAPEALPEFEHLEEQGRITLIRREYRREDILDADLVLAATDDARVNADIYSACRCMGILVNVCSDRTKCDFYFPGIAVKGDVVAGVTASGADHREARRIRERIQELLDEESGRENTGEEER